MITVIKGISRTGKIMKVIEIANQQGEDNHKKVLIITQFPFEYLLSLDNIVLAKASDENITNLINNAEIILIDEVGTMIEGVELVYLSNLGKEVYYTAQRLAEDMPYDEIIDIELDTELTKSWDNFVDKPDSPVNLGAKLQIVKENNAKLIEIIKSSVSLVDLDTLWTSEVKFKFLDELIEEFKVKGIPETIEADLSWSEYDDFINKRRRLEN